MRSWKRRTRGIRKMSRKTWFYKYLYQGEELRSVYKRFLKNEKRKIRQRLTEQSAIREESKGKTHYEDCSYHPCLITKLDIENFDIEGESLIDGTRPRSCSLNHCGVVFFTEEEATERADFIKEHGWDTYYAKYLPPNEGI